MNSALLDRSPSEEQLASPNVLSEPQLRFAEAHLQPELIDVAAENIRLMQEAANSLEDEIEWTVIPNDSIGYHRRHIELVQSGASDVEIQRSSEAKRHNVATDLLEKVSKLTDDVPPPRVYKRRNDGLVVDGDFIISEMMYNGLRGVDPKIYPIENERRIYEGANFLTIQNAPDHIDNVTQKAWIEISQCNHEKGAPGYVKETNKLQIRYSTYIEDGDGLSLVMQPAYIDGRLLDEQRISRFLTGHDNLSRTSALARMIQVDREEFADVLQFVTSLDEFTSSELGEPVFMGRRGKGDYADVMPKTEQRLNMIQSAIDEIDELSDELAAQGASPVEAEFIIVNREKELVMEIALQNPGLAASAFDEETEQRVQSFVKNHGTTVANSGASEFSSIVSSAPELQGCGDSCGLNEATNAVAAIGSAVGLKEYQLTGKMYVDKKSYCPVCGSGGVLRGGNGMVCLSKNCGSRYINGEKTINGADSKSVQKSSWWKSYREIVAEDRAKELERLRQEDQAQYTIIMASQNN